MHQLRQGREADRDVERAGAREQRRQSIVPGDRSLAAAFSAVDRHVQEEQRQRQRQQAGKILLGIERDSELAEQVGRNRDGGQGQCHRQDIHQPGHDASC